MLDEMADSYNSYGGHIVFVHITTKKTPITFSTRYKQYWPGFLKNVNANVSFLMILHFKALSLLVRSILLGFLRLFDDYMFDMRPRHCLPRNLCFVKMDFCDHTLLNLVGLNCW